MDRLIALKNVIKLPSGLTDQQVRERLAKPKLIGRNAGAVFGPDAIKFMVNLYREVHGDLK